MPTHIRQLKNGETVKRLKVLRSDPDRSSCYGGGYICECTHCGHQASFSYSNIVCRTSFWCSNCYDRRKPLPNKRIVLDKHFSPGDTRGPWTVIEIISANRYKCRCRCGSVKSFSRQYFLRTVHKSSCARCHNLTNCTTHGMSYSPLYAVWSNLKFKNRLCEEWADDFQCFADDVGTPETGFWIERPDRSKPYGPYNVYWKITKRVRRHVNRPISPGGT